MVFQHKERRKFGRIYLKPDQAVVLLQTPKDSEDICGRILNMSEGGFGLGMKRDEISKFSIGNDLKIKEIFGSDEFRIEGEIILSVRWILDFQGISSIGAGCSFSYIDEIAMNQLLRIIEKHR